MKMRKWEVIEMANLFSTIVTMIVTSTFTIVAVMVFRLFLKPAPRIFSYLLWIAVLIRLIFPILPQSDYFGVALHWEVMNISDAIQGIFEYD